jgi:hypothetical protein
MGQSEERLETADVRLVVPGRPLHLHLRTKSRGFQGCIRWR